MNPQTPKPVSPELEALINLATRALNEHINQAGLCAVGGCTWPWEHAVLAASMTDPGRGRYRECAR